jgi:hypothetical protein
VATTDEYQNRSVADTHAAHYASVASNAGIDKARKFGKGDLNDGVAKQISRLNPARARNDRDIVMVNTATRSDEFCGRDGIG